MNTRLSVIHGLSVSTHNLISEQTWDIQTEQRPDKFQIAELTSTHLDFQLQLMSHLNEEFLENFHFIIITHLFRINLGENSQCDPILVPHV